MSDPQQEARIKALEAQVAQKDAEIMSLWQQLEATNIEETMRVKEENNQLKQQVTELTTHIKDLEMAIASMTPSKLAAPKPHAKLAPATELVPGPSLPGLEGGGAGEVPVQPYAVPDLSDFAQFSSPPPVPPSVKAPTPEASGIVTAKPAAAKPVKPVPVVSVPPPIAPPVHGATKPVKPIPVVSIPPPIAPAAPAPPAPPKAPAAPVPPAPPKAPAAPAPPAPPKAPAAPAPPPTPRVPVASGIVPSPAVPSLPALGELPTMEESPISLPGGELDNLPDIDAAPSAPATPELPDLDLAPTVPPMLAMPTIPELPDLEATSPTPTTPEMPDLPENTVAKAPAKPTSPKSEVAKLVAPAKPATPKDEPAKPAAPPKLAHTKEAVTVPEPMKPAKPATAVPLSGVRVSVYFEQGPTGDPAQWVDEGFNILISITKANHSGEEIGTNLDKFKDDLKVIVNYCQSMFPMTRKAHELRKKKDPLDDAKVKELVSEIQGWKSEVLGKIK